MGDGLVKFSQSLKAFNGKRLAKVVSVERENKIKKTLKTAQQGRFYFLLVLIAAFINSLNNGCGLWT